MDFGKLQFEKIGGFIYMIISEGRCFTEKDTDLKLKVRLGILSVSILCSYMYIKKCLGKELDDRTEG